MVSTYLGYLLNGYNASHWLLIVLATIVAILTVYYLVVYLPLYFKKAKESALQEKLPPLSVVIAARNEEENLVENLPRVLDQNYPEFEVIVVDDCSQDMSISVLRAFSPHYSNLKFTQIKESKTFDGGKKFALTMGIKKAKYDYLVFTDADCEVPSADWLKSYGRAFSENSEVVLGFGDYRYRKTFLSRLIKTDAFLIAAQYLGFSNLGLTYMGVGRNLGYKKDLFFKNKGFSKHMHLRSGDDDLFISSIPVSLKSKLLLDSYSKTYSEPKNTFKDWIRQKKRHLTTFANYKWWHLFSMGIYSVSTMLFWVFSLIALVLFTDFHLLYFLIFFRFLLFQLTFGMLSKKLDSEKVSSTLLITEPLLIGCYLYLILSKIDLRRRPWK